MSLLFPESAPSFSLVYIPALPSLALSDAERALISRLQMRMWRQRAYMELTRSYYMGEQVLTNLEIAIPPELSFLRTIVGWARIAVDPLVARMSIDGFRLPGALHADPDLEDVWLLNRMDAEQSLAFTDAFSMGRSWFTLGSPEEPGDVPLMCIESPLNVVASWDARGSKPKEMLQSYWLDARRHAALYLPDETVQIAENDDRVWEIVGRDKHNLGRIPAVRMANSASSDNRDGASEITTQVMSLIDAACRTLLGLEVAREFYSVPQKIILGATEADFKNADGETKSAWSTYISRILALERDSEGQLPEIKQFTPYDPSAFTKIIESLAGQVGGLIDANPQELGLYTQGNPVSADSNDSIADRRVSRARHKQRMLGGAAIEAMQIAGMLMNKGTMPESYRRMAVDWMDAADFNLAAATDAISKQVEIGAISPTADVTLKKLGWSVVERAQHEQARKIDAGAQVLAELATSIQGKEAHADLSIARNIETPAIAAPVTGGK